MHTVTISHYFVAQAVVSGLMDVGLRTNTPILSVSLTPHHFQPSAEHHAFFTEHFLKKGREAADAALQVCTIYGGTPTVAEAVA